MHSVEFAFNVGYVWRCCSVYDWKEGHKEGVQQSNLGARLVKMYFSYARPQMSVFKVEFWDAII